MGASNVWIVSAVAASVLWGIGYTLAGKLTHSGLTPITLNLLLSLFAMPFYLFFSFRTGEYKTAFEIFRNNDNLYTFVVFYIAAMIIGNLLITISIAHKNASLSSLIEITYPLFIILLSWLLFREVHLNLMTAIGGGFILAGVSIIYWHA